MSLAARAALLAAGLLSIAPATAVAADAPVFALKPVGHADLGYYRFDARPGETIRARVRVVNVGSVAGTAGLAVVDAATGATTGAVYETVGGASEDVGAWARVGAARVALAPGDSRIVGFTVSVPADARRGQHLGGLVAYPMVAPGDGSGGSGDHSFRVDIVDQSILAVQVDLPGPARGLLAVRGIEAGGNPGYQTLVIALSNPGERMVKGSGSVTITAAGGKAVTRQDFAIDTFLPRTRVEYPLVLRGDALVPGGYRAEVMLRWDGGQTSRTELPFSVTRHNVEQAYGSEALAQLPGAPGGAARGAPVALLAGGGLLVMLLGFGAALLYFRRRTRELERRLGIAPPEDGGGMTITDARVPATPAGETEQPAGRV
jgi:hypothetical protein